MSKVLDVMTELDFKKKKYRKKPLVVEAVRLQGCPTGLLIETIEGTMLAQEGDWIVTGIHGERYPVKDEIFVKSYEECVDE